jgi:hypothetical protein
MLETASDALQMVRELVLSASQQLESLQVIKGSGIISQDEERAEEMRLTIMLERAVAMLEKLGTFHQRTTAVSAAALVFAMNRGNLTDSAERQERNASPRRRLASASDMVIDS